MNQWESIAANHVLRGGNQRTAWAAERLLYQLNSYRAIATENRRFDFMLAVATRQLDTVAKIAERLSAITSR